MVKETPMVSIVCVAFNHEKFIRKAVEGFLAQRTDFRFEVILHDDASSDGTADIIREYAAKYPDLIVPVLQTENQFSKGNKPWCICFPMARGKYIALCEGDDHWVDPLKLKKQVDSFNEDPHAVGCYTSAYNEVNGVREAYHGGEVMVPKGTRLTMPDYLHGEGIPTCTFVFLRSMLKDPAGFIQGFATGDTALFTYLLLEGHFIYMPEFTAVRVKHTGGVYSMQARSHHLRVSMQNRVKQNEVTGGRYKGILQERIHGRLRHAWDRAMQEQDMELAKLAWSHLSKERSVMGWSLPGTWFNGLLVHYPGLVSRLVGVKQGFRRLLGGAPRT